MALSLSRTVLSSGAAGACASKMAAQAAQSSTAMPITNRRVTAYDQGPPAAGPCSTGVQWEGPILSPKVELYTKEGCTLCKHVRETLMSLKDEIPHSLYTVDIMDADKEKLRKEHEFELPVVRIDGIVEAVLGLNKTMAKELLVQASFKKGRRPPPAFIPNLAEESAY
mmetsp:Transcript_52549/g.125509  ORF Transcript_52549/g.125509 Transcript_52549/m.125509 type:complete len:168 (-) Transcript_52549:93-596(-)|eukprot:CAMPEP_0178459682 /NCGR_PEP_ID=MMETSP0689_2-20121128/48266_1 /TAXON_ID=160604 /ORGANISM="Amphidinium massartii, Strain CS-259" /LENGTH=167 /DNA_ID=CAMNT_0020086187 /DNA_START=56 /DNA_END=559 /DNA_ORIENTATION=+